jgi:cold shock CspA family protein
VTQGTIKHYDDDSHTGSLLLDDSTEVGIDASSIGDEAIRTLRLGQRVKFEVGDDQGHPVARGLRLVTFE